jgi:hypothetical protein
MSKRRHTSHRSVITTHDEEGFSPIPVQHIASVAGSSSVSVQQVMVPISPQKVPIAPYGGAPSDLVGDSYDADVDGEDLGNIHYIKARHGKRYPAAVSFNTMLPSHPFLIAFSGCTTYWVDLAPRFFCRRNVAA